MGWWIWGGKENFRVFLLLVCFVLFVVVGNDCVVLLNDHKEHAIVSYVLLLQGHHVEMS